MGEAGRFESPPADQSFMSLTDLETDTARPYWQRVLSGRAWEPGAGPPGKEKPFGRIFQVRWREALGRPECPYLYRWMLILLGFSVRLHHWVRSDDRRFFHDHASDFVSIILKGRYRNVTPNGTFEAQAGSVWRSDALRRHYLDIPREGAWTLLLCGRPYHKWGFYVNGHRWRPLRYFSKYGVIQDESYQ